MSNGLVPVKTPDQVTQEKIKAGEIPIATATAIPDSALSSLAAHIRRFWSAAVKAKKAPEDQMLKNLRQIEGIYEPDVAAAIKEVDAPMIYAKLTDAKCRSAIAWIKEVIIQPQPPWSIETTPEPDMPDTVIAQIRNTFIQEAFSTLMTSMSQSGQPVDPMMVFSQVRQMIPVFEEEMKKIVLKKAKEITQKLKVTIDDRLVEGGWYEALEDCIPDIVQLKAGFIKGPVYRKEKVKKPEQSEEGKFKIVYKDQVIPKYEWRSAFNIYPSPDSTGINDGGVIDLISIRSRDLHGLIGVEGFKKEEIEAVITDYGTGGLQEWTKKAAEMEVAMIQGIDSSSVWQSQKIDCLEYWDVVSGKMLIEWGMTKKEIPDPTKQYPICAWLIGTHVIKAMLNEDPLGKIPFHKVSFNEKPGVFWGEGLPELIADIIRSLNACFRAILYNIGVGSGPQTEIDQDRLAPGESPKLWPWRVWLTKNETMLNQPAIRFYAPPMVVERLISAFNFYSKLVDEYSGVPAYAHGDPQVGGAGNTASGLSMLITQAARGIKNVIKNIDRNLIEPTVTAQFEMTIGDEQNIGLIPDYKIIARGSSTLIAKEQQAIRRTEFLAITNNPLDSQIMGAEGRSYLLEAAAQPLDLDLDKLLPNRNNPQAQLPQQAIASPAAPQTLNAGGEPVVGTDFRQFGQR